MLLFHVFKKISLKPKIRINLSLFSLQIYIMYNIDMFLQV